MFILIISACIAYLASSEARATSNPVSRVRDEFSENGTRSEPQPLGKKSAEKKARSLAIIYHVDG